MMSAHRERPSVLKAVGIGAGMDNSNHAPVRGSARSHDLVNAAAAKAAPQGTAASSGGQVRVGSGFATHYGASARAQSAQPQKIQTPMFREESSDWDSSRGLGTSRGGTGHSAPVVKSSGGTGTSVTRPPEKSKSSSAGHGLPPPHPAPSSLLPVHGNNKSNPAGQQRTISGSAAPRPAPAVSASSSTASLHPPMKELGLSNLGNTCYTNAVLAALLSTPPFMRALLDESIRAGVRAHLLGPRIVEQFSAGVLSIEQVLALPVGSALNVGSASANTGADTGAGAGAQPSPAVGAGRKRKAVSSASADAIAHEPLINPSLKGLHPEIAMTSLAQHAWSSKRAATADKFIVYNALCSLALHRAAKVPISRTDLKQFKEVLGRVNEDFGTYRQQDAHEMVAQLLNALHEELEPVTRAIAHATGALAADIAVARRKYPLEAQAAFDAPASSASVRRAREDHDMVVDGASGDSTNHRGRQRGRGRGASAPNTQSSRGAEGSRQGGPGRSASQGLGRAGEDVHAQLERLAAFASALRSATVRWSLQRMTPTARAFNMEITATLTCDSPSCGYTRTRAECFRDITLDLPEPVRSAHDTSLSSANVHANTIASAKRASAAGQGQQSKGSDLISLSDSENDGEEVEDKKRAGMDDSEEKGESEASDEEDCDDEEEEEEEEPPSPLPGGFGDPMDAVEDDEDRAAHPGDMTLLAMLRTYFLPRKLRLKCPYCEEKWARVAYALTAVPAVLILQLKRFEWYTVSVPGSDGVNASRVRKRNDAVVFPTVLPMGRWCPRAEAVPFELGKGHPTQGPAVLTVDERVRLPPPIDTLPDSWDRLRVRSASIREAALERGLKMEESKRHLRVVRQEQVSGYPSGQAAAASGHSSGSGRTTGPTLLSPKTGTGSTARGSHQVSVGRPNGTLAGIVKPKIPLVAQGSGISRSPGLHNAPDTRQRTNTVQSLLGKTGTGLLNTPASKNGDRGWMPSQEESDDDDEEIDDGSGDEGEQQPALESVRKAARTPSTVGTQAPIPRITPATGSGQSIPLGGQVHVTAASGSGMDSKDFARQISSAKRNSMAGMASGMAASLNSIPGLPFGITVHQAPRSKFGGGGHTGSSYTPSSGGSTGAQRGSGSRGGGGGGSNRSGVGSQESNAAFAGLKSSHHKERLYGSGPGRDRKVKVVGTGARASSRASSRSVTSVESGREDGDGPGSQDAAPRDVGDSEDEVTLQRKPSVFGISAAIQSGKLASIAEPHRQLSPRAAASRDRVHTSGASEFLKDSGFEAATIRQSMQSEQVRKQRLSKDELKEEDDLRKAIEASKADSEGTGVFTSPSSLAARKQAAAGAYDGGGGEITDAELALTCNIDWGDEFWGPDPFQPIAGFTFAPDEEEEEQLAKEDCADGPPPNKKAKLAPQEEEEVVLVEDEEEEEEEVDRTKRKHEGGNDGEADDGSMSPVSGLCSSSRVPCPAVSAPASPLRTVTSLAGRSAPASPFKQKPAMASSQLSAVDETAASDGATGGDTAPRRALGKGKEREEKGQTDPPPGQVVEVGTVMRRPCPIYDLTAVVRHQGASANHGHYTTDVRSLFSLDMPSDLGLDVHVAAGRAGVGERYKAATGPHDSMIVIDSDDEGAVQGVPAPAVGSLPPAELDERRARLKPSRTWVRHDDSDVRHVSLADVMSEASQRAAYLLVYTLRAPIRPLPAPGKG